MVVAQQGRKRGTRAHRNSSGGRLQGVRLTTVEKLQIRDFCPDAHVYVRVICGRTLELWHM